MGLEAPPRQVQGSALVGSGAKPQLSNASPSPSLGEGGSPSGGRAAGGEGSAPARKGWWTGWRYIPEGRRDLRLDFLRGFCAFAMVVDHLGGASYLYPLTGGNRFFVSAAEGFIFLSGLLVGLIYGPRIARDGLGAVQMHVLRRAFTLYGVTLGLTFTFVGLSRLSDMPWLQDVEPLTPALLASLLTLHHTYYLVDVMLLYTLVLAVSPLALLLLHTGKTWVVLLFSVGFWLLYQWFPDQVALPWHIVNNDTFQTTAWQLWFFVGMVVGYHRDRIWRILGRLPLVPSAVALSILAAALIVLRVTDGAPLAPLAPTLGIQTEPSASPAQPAAAQSSAGAQPDVARGLVPRQTGAPAAQGAPALGTQAAESAPGSPGDPGQAVLDAVFDKHVARPGRVVAFAVFFPLLYLLLTYAWRPLARVAGWLLLPFGQNALYVYALHLFAIYLSALILPYVPGYDRFVAWENTPVQIAALLLIWLMVKRQVLFDVIPR